MADDAPTLVTVRVIKSFEYRTCRNIVLPVDLDTMTVGELKRTCRERVGSDAKFKPYRNVVFDTLKIYSQAFRNKTQNLIINLDNAGFLDDDGALLKAVGIEKETELSLFNRDAYTTYAANPSMRW